MANDKEKVIEALVAYLLVEGCLVLMCYAAELKLLMQPRRMRGVFDWTF